MNAKVDCFSLDEAVEYLQVKKGELYNFLTLLNIQRYRFARDRRTYILKSDVEKIKEMLSQSAQG